MSGTSVDGIDAALVEFESATQLRVIESYYSSFDDALVQKINRLAHSRTTPQRSDYAELDRELAHIYANACLQLICKSGIKKNSITAIANHGQTIAHEPSASPPSSLQIGDPQLLANLTGLTTISQFRQADLAAGGQGAPLMPAFHQALFGNTVTANSGNRKARTFVLNLGGIANITALGGSVIGGSVIGGSVIGDAVIGDAVIGFDTGPANTLLNQWINHCRQLPYDEDGSWGAQGNVVPEVLEQLLKDSYFAQDYPKSTGPDYFNLAWLTDTVDRLEQYRPRDIQATLLEFTVETIAMGFGLLQTNRGSLYACGGGVHNRALMQRLANRLNHFDLKLCDEFGVPADLLEATGFAWLGYCHLHGIPSNLPSVTGASMQVVLGERWNPTKAVR